MKQLRQYVYYRLLHISFTDFTRIDYIINIYFSVLLLCLVNIVTTLVYTFILVIKIYIV